MSTVIDTALLLKILEKTPASHNIMLMGKHGIGKSQILEKFYSTKGCKVVTLFLGQMSDPGDLIGIPHENAATGKTEFMPPYWFPLDDTPVVLFLDELNRARPEVLQTIMDLALNRKLAGRSLPEGSRIISAVNNGDEYQLTELDPALVSRFNIYEFVPSVSEWIDWASRSGVDNRIISFINNYPDLLDSSRIVDNGESCMEKNPDRRGWERVSSIINGEINFDEDLKIMVSGIVGKKAANQMFDFFDKNRLLSAEEILNGDFEKIKTKLAQYDTPEFAAINDELFTYLNGTSLDSEYKNHIAHNFTEYWNYINEKDYQEVKAHFSNIVAGTAFPEALVFIINECPEIFEKVTSFVSELR